MRAFVLALPLLAAACAAPSLGSGTERLQILQSGVLPPPARIDLTTSERPYLIGPFDKLIIDVFGIEDMSAREIQADASGRISFPLIGSVDAAGKTSSELAAAIAQQLRGRFVRNPQVTVNLKETVSQVVTVDGEVKEPGLYPVVGRMSLLSAIATAKGTAEFARLSDVVVFRTVNGQKLAALYNVAAIRNGSVDDPEIFANDVVVVGRSRARQIFRDVLTIAPSITYPVVALIQR